MTFRLKFDTIIIVVRSDMMQSKLKELLDKYIEEYENLKLEYEDKVTKSELYKELLSYFDNNYDDLENNTFCIVLLLNSIYNDNIYEKEFYKLLSRMKNDNYNKVNEYRSFSLLIRRDYNKILEELESLKNRIKRNRNIVSSARRAKLSFKYNNPIEDSRYVVSDLKVIISYYETSGVISSKEAVLCINDIDLYNRILATQKSGNKDEEKNTKNIYNEIPNILNAGYEVISEPEVDIERKASLDRFTNQIINTLKYTEKDKIIELLDSYKKYDLENNEYNYIIVKILNNYNSELIIYYQLLLEKDTHALRSNIKEIIKDYYINLNKYLIVRDFYNKINDFIIDEEEEDELTPEEINELKVTKRFIYSASPSNPTNAKIIKDIDDVPKEYYDTVLDLINKFKDGTIAKKEYKKLTNNKRLIRFSELKRDQVRIVLKHIKDNIYNIMGVFVKKNNNDNTMYQTMANRIIPDISTEDKLNSQLELAIYTEDKLADLVKEKGRKGTR